jgi:hypothetical protein
MSRPALRRPVDLAGGSLRPTRLTWISTVLRVAVDALVMGRVVLDVSMTLDGFTAGPDVREAEPMEDGGERLHAWMAGNGTDSEIDVAVRRAVDATVGAAVIGRRTFDLGMGP